MRPSAILFIAGTVLALALTVSAQDNGCTARLNRQSHGCPGGNNFYCWPAGIPGGETKCNPQSGMERIEGAYENGWGESCDCCAQPVCNGRIDVEWVGGPQRRQ